MANSYDRRINLYINGKEVQNTLSGIQKEMFKSTNELRRMTIGTDEYNRKASEVKKLKQIYSDHQAQLRATVSPLQKLTEFAKGLLPAFGFAAIAAGAKKAFDQVIASTDTLSTQWAVFMGGMNQATNEFFRTIATGDWSNFLTNMNEAIRVGREYQEMLDEIEEMKRALDINEASRLMEIRTLEDMVRNSSLDNDTRRVAAERRIKIEEELTVMRSKLAQEAYNAELMVAAQETKLSEERLLRLASDFDSETKIKAKAYIDQQNELKKLQAKSAISGAQSGILYPGMQGVAQTNPDLQKLKAEIDATSSTVKDYATLYSQLGDTTDAQLNKMTAAFGNLKKAEVSALENTRRVRSTMYSIIDEDNRKAAAAGGGKTAGGTSAEQGITPLTTLGEVKLVDEKQIEIDALKAMETHWTEYLRAETDKQIDILAQQFQIEKEIAEARIALKDIQVAAIGQLASSLTGMFEQGSAAQIAMIAVERAIAIAQILINLAREKSSINLAAAQMSLIPFVGPSLAIAYKGAMTAKAVAQAKINTGLVLASTIASAVSSGKREKAPKYAAGGFTNGAKMYVAGEAGTEWIAPNSMVKHPATAPIIAALENMRTSRLSPAAIEAFAAGGYSRKSTSRSADNLPDFNFSNNSSIAPLLAATAKALDENAKATREFMKWKPKVYTEMIKKDLDNLEKIQKTRGL
jgi:hypothetical protein